MLQIVPSSRSWLPRVRILAKNFLIVGVLCVGFGFAVSGWANSAESAADRAPQAILHILDYVSVDYVNVLKDGEVVNESEYAEQLEFASQLVNLMQQLPAVPQTPSLLGAAGRLQTAIEGRQSPVTVVELCTQMSVTMIGAYHIQVFPETTPELGDAAALYAENCSACHGAEGFGNGPLATTLEPRPANFHLAERQQHRNVFSLYNTISLGVDGTAMPAFTRLGKQQRWALAFYVSNFVFNDAERTKGQALWATKSPNPIISDIEQLTLATPMGLQLSLGADGVAQLAYLRANPSVLTATNIPPLQIARDKLIASASAYQRGDQRLAYQLSIAAYLEGYELVEKQLSATAPDLKDQIEQAMMQYRKQIKDRFDAAKISATQIEILAMLDKADAQLDTSRLDATVNFLSAFIILLREGIEAILILAAITAVLNKTGRRDAMKYIHAGWMGALLLGFLTWVVANQFIDISGAGRELTEGVTALVAAAMLVYVGFWLHKQTYAMAWSHFIKNKVSKAVSDGALTGLAAVAFVAVYREVFESILFYNSLWLQAETAAGHNTIILGVLTAALVLAVVAWAIFKFSVRLPLTMFFRVNAVLLYVLAIVFAGKGVAALQKAGVFPVDSIPFFQVEALGIYPNLQTLAAQGILIGLAVLLLVYNRNKIDHKQEAITKA